MNNLEIILTVRHTVPFNCSFNMDTCVCPGIHDSVLCFILFPSMIHILRKVHFLYEGNRKLLDNCGRIENREKVINVKADDDHFISNCSIFI